MSKDGTPLIKLRSDLRNLKYSDTGDKPYVQHEIPPYEKDGRRTNQINARTNDLERFVKLLVRKPGLKFQGNQALLQQAGTINDLKNGVQNGFKGFDLKKLKDKAIDTLKNNALATTAIFAQVPLNGTGTHFINNGGSTYLKAGGEPEPGSAFGNFLRDALGPGSGGVDGASKALSGTPIGPDSGPLNADYKITNQESKYGPTDNKTYLNRIGSDQPLLASDTVKSVQEARKTDPNRKAKILFDNFAPNVEFTQFQTKEVLKDKKTVFAPAELLKYQLKDGKTYTQSPLYIQTKYGLGDHGNVDKSKVKPDKVNSYDVLTRRALGDIIPFEFQVFAPWVMNTEVKSQDKYLYFRAFLDDFSDNYTGDWSGTKYVGRAEEFYTYQGFKRDISFNFKMAALSRKEMYPLYNKLNNLVASTAPTYAENGQFMRGTMVKVTVGDYLDRVAGFISSVNLSWDKNYPWEIDVESLGTPKVPHILNIAVNFTPIHDFNVKADIDVQQGEVYIGRKVFAAGNEEEQVAPPKGETAFFYTNGFTYEYDKATNKVVAVNGQPTNYVNGGFAYKENGEQAVITKVNGTDSTL